MVKEQSLLHVPTSLKFRNIALCQQCLFERYGS